MRQKLIEDIIAFVPFNDQEAADKEVILALLKQVPDLFERTNLTAHMTASAWVVNPERNKVLMAYHNLYDSWAWLGGHADGCEDLLGVALKEVREESGILGARPVSDRIFSLEILTVDGHVKKGSYVPSHLHLNVTYLVEGDEDREIRAKEDENSAVAWFDLEESLDKSTEPWFVERIYKKLNQKLAGY